MMKQDSYDYDNEEGCQEENEDNDENQETETYNYELIKDDLFTELNTLRQNPKSFIPYIKEQLTRLKGNKLTLDSKTIIETSEGRPAYEEAIEFLSQQEPVEPLKSEQCLDMASYDLINDIGPRGLVSHQDSMGGFVSDRIERYCEWDYCANECIEISSQTPRDILIDLIVDDGIPDRLDRKALFQNIYHFVGIGCGPHKEYGIVTVLIFVGNIRPKGTLFYECDDENFEDITQDYLNRRIVNDYQIDDPDAPDNTVGLRLVKSSKSANGRIVFVTKKFYKLDDGREHVVEVEEY